MWSARVARETRRRGQSDPSVKRTYLPYGTRGGVTQRRQLEAEVRLGLCISSGEAKRAAREGLTAITLLEDPMGQSRRLPLINVHRTETIWIR